MAVTHPALSLSARPGSFGQHKAWQTNSSPLVFGLNLALPGVEKLS